jgi:hypothetical protein
MSIDDGAAYRQPHACSTGLCGVEGIEDSIEIRRINTWPGIADGPSVEPLDRVAINDVISFLHFGRSLGGLKLS